VRAARPTTIPIGKRGRSAVAASNATGFHFAQRRGQRVRGGGAPQQLADLVCLAAVIVESGLRRVHPAAVHVHADPMHRHRR
jgi:hypothetical protein